MMSFVAQEAAFDERLTPLALRLLIYIGGENPQVGGETYIVRSTIARKLNTDALSIKRSLHLLHKHHYVTRRVAIIRSTFTGRRIHKWMYRTTSDVPSLATSERKHA